MKTIVIDMKDLNIITATVKKNGSEKAKKALSRHLQALADLIAQQDVEKKISTVMAQQEI